MAVKIDIASEGPPKRQIIEMAFSDAGSAGYEFGRTPEEVADALNRLNALMAEWKDMRGIDLGYDQPNYGVGNADDLSGIPFATLNTVAAFLALRICPMMGAALGPDAKANLARSLVMLESQYAKILPMPMQPATPRGLGGQFAWGPLGPFINEGVVGDSEED
jgi:hypothetical protein